MTSPGWCECECGVIRSISIERGGEQTWTAENLPREIIVRLSVADMYSSLMLSKSNTYMKYNTGLLSYVECMAGIRFDQLNIIKRTAMKLKINGSQRMENVLTLRGLTARQGDRVYNTTQRLLKILR